MPGLLVSCRPSPFAVCGGRRSVRAVCVAGLGSLEIPPYARRRPLLKVLLYFYARKYIGILATADFALSLLGIPTIFDSRSARVSLSGGARSAGRRVAGCAHVACL